MASKNILFLKEKIHWHSHPWPLEPWPGHCSGQTTWPVHKNIVAKSDLASNGLQEYFVSKQKSPLALTPLTSRDVTRAFFWPKYLRFIKTLSQNLIWPLMASNNCQARLLLLSKSLNSTLKVSIQKQKEQSWRYNLSSPTHPPTTRNF